MKLKTREEVIQDQIDEIMDNFDFAKVKRVMDLMKWEWASVGVPDEHDLRSAARRLLKDISRTGAHMSATGGFRAALNKGTDAMGPWVCVGLTFNIETFENEGESYLNEENI